MIDVLLNIAPAWWWAIYFAGIVVCGLMCWRIREKKP